MIQSYLLPREYRAIVLSKEARDNITRSKGETLQIHVHDNSSTRMQRARDAGCQKDQMFWNNNVRLDSLLAALQERFLGITRCERAIEACEEMPW